MSKTADALMGQLKKAIPGPKAGKSKTAAKRSESTPASQPAPDFARRAPLSVSLYQRDLERIDEIQQFMRGRGYRRLSDSEALRLACRTAPIGEDMIHAYHDMQGEDGRRKAS